LSERRPLNRQLAKDVMIACRRRCCLCVYLEDRDQVRKGQIAHLNRRRNDDRFDNLVYLCFEHHDEYDSQTSQSKRLSKDEVKEYRDRLYSRYPDNKAIIRTARKGVMPQLKPLKKTATYKPFSYRSRYKALISRQWRFPLWQVANQPELFAYNTPMGTDGVCLVERIDLPDGRIVIVCMVAIGNPGTSITNCVETLCLQVCARFDIPPKKLVWLEHYDLWKSQDWNLVRFSPTSRREPFQNPTWVKMTPEIWDDLKLRPKARLRQRFGSFESKVTKKFFWPKEAIL
jgi:hypothetical protein